MHSHVLMLMMLLCLAVSGCVSSPVSHTPARVVTDETFGHYHEDLESDLILITMTPERYALLTEMQSVPMSGELPPRYAEFLDRLQSGYGLKRVANWPLPAIEIFCVVFEIQDPRTRDTVVAALELEPEVETAQIVQTFDVQAQDYNDPYLSLQHGLQSIQALNSHQWSRGKGVKVAVIDTGMDNTHPDLAFSGEATRNFVDSDDTRFRADTHGTAVAGIIAAHADNDTGMVGVAPDASLLAVKACWHVEQGESQARCNSLTLAKALDYSIQQKVDIINLSLTGPPDPVLERLVLEALTRGIVVIGAVPDHEEEAFPVSIRGTIAVAMSGERQHSIVAPGRRVLSTLPDRQYDFFDGSSFSTAHISGLAALLRSLSPSLSPSELLALLELTANPETGAVNACCAVDWARRVSVAEGDVYTDNNHRSHRRCTACPLQTPP
ncbi:S8 family serine peptidase [Granulosicoccus sp. 3-233]|uniref:S8 family serine peptidase n=1 Tax=Granulosicoccus sp. 3-233 TaxID=3417969 RepID=UPI003D337F50